MKQCNAVSIIITCLHLSSYGANEQLVMISRNPSDHYQRIGEVPCSSRAEIDACVARARAAYPAWSALSVQERVEILRSVYDVLDKRRDEIKALVVKEIGMPMTVCERIDIEAGFSYLRGYLDHAEVWLAPEVTFKNEHEEHTLFFEGRGVAGVSVAWNYPFCNFVWGVMQNLIVGNTVVFKHSEECPLLGVLLEEIMKTSKLPQGVFNVVHGVGADVGEYLMNSNIDIIHFTGSSKVGKHLYEIAARKFIPAILELGGSAPAIVCEDADMALVVESVYFNRFMNSGQTCDGLKRLIVHRSRVDGVVAGLRDILSKKRVGNAEDPLTDMGPLVAQRQVDVIQQQVADALQKGATVAYCGTIDTHLSGAYYAPTILTNVTSDMRVWKEEVFGPVLPLVTFDTLEEAIALANDTSYGLGGYVYTQNKDQACEISRKLVTGNVTVNGADYVIPEDPFGGCKNSGMGREHGKHGLRELCTVKLVAMR
jgi:aldehyde dehydrogenase (NAD+)